MEETTKRQLLGAAQIGFIAAAAALVYGFVTVAREGEHRRACTAECLAHPDYAGADRKAPDFTLKDMGGHDVSLASYRGKVVLLNFWTKNCGPCLEEMPNLGDLAHILKPRADVVVLTVSTDEGPADVRDTLKSVLREDPPPFTVLFDPDGEKVVGGKFGTHLFPETWLIDQRGVLRARFDGAREWSNSAIVELVDQIRAGDYCPLIVDKQSDPDGVRAAGVCDPLSGG